MNKILLALAILSAGAGGFLTARQSATQLHHEANTAREAWLAQTQLVAVAQSDQVDLTEHIRELKQALAQTQPVENALWSALRTNRAGHLPPELRERLFEEFGFNWQSSEEFIVVSKDTVREIQMPAIRGNGNLTGIATTVLALTPGERAQVETAIQRVQTDFKDWALSHTERAEPKDDVVAQYALPGDPAMSISNNFVTEVFNALGRERAELIIAFSPSWMNHTGIRGEPRTLIVKRYLAANEERLKVQTQNPDGSISSRDLWQGPRWGLAQFPEAFRPLFPNGWADVAEREGFEMPRESQKK